MRQLRLSFGSSASRRPSPIRLMASTVIRMARPGSHHPPGPERMNSRASASIVPHSGVGGWAPMPRKPSAAASRMALETQSVACTMSGARQFGRIGREHQPQRPGAGDPRRRDIVLAEFAEHRGPGQADIMRLVDDGDGDHGVGRPGPRIATTTRASSRLGTARMTSITRMIATSTRARHGGEQAERRCRSRGDGHHHERR